MNRPQKIRVLSMFADEESAEEPEEYDLIVYRPRLVERLYPYLNTGLVMCISVSHGLHALTHLAPDHVYPVVQTITIPILVVTTALYMVLWYAMVKVKRD